MRLISKILLYGFKVVTKIAIAHAILSFALSFHFQFSFSSIALVTMATVNPSNQFSVFLRFIPKSIHVNYKMYRKLVNVRVAPALYQSLNPA